MLTMYLQHFGWKSLHCGKSLTKLIMRNLVRPFMLLKACISLISE